jgi:hypothetical protein
MNQHSKRLSSINASWLAILVMVLSPTSGLFAQDESKEASTSKSSAASSLEAAKQISAASGRPIFAIAGRST